MPSRRSCTTCSQAELQKQAWVPFFDDADAIIYVVPVDRFIVQETAGDGDTVRYSVDEDSKRLLRAICKICQSEDTSLTGKNRTIVAGFALSDTLASLVE